MKSPAFRIALCAIMISLIGIICIYSSTSQKEGKMWQLIYQRQIIWVILGLVVFSIMSNINYRRLWDWTYFLYALVLLLLFFVVISGVVRLGAQRWLKVAWFNVQPSEIVKPVVVVLLARYFSAKSADDISLKINSYGIIRALVIPFMLVAIPAFLIIEQPDLGSGAIVICIFAIMLYVANVKLKFIFVFLSLIVFSLPFVWSFLRDYQKDRLLVFLNPNLDPLGAGYTVIQSKIAVGSGGLLGQGWLSGTQNQLHFLPESHTDFIFAVFVEEWGFIGAAVLLLLYFLLIRQGLLIGLRTRDNFGRLLACGISVILAIQVFINVSMNMGLAPVVGLPLPLMSYGGSSIVVTFASLGILVSISRRRVVF